MVGNHPHGQALYPALWRPPAGPDPALPVAAEVPEISQVAPSTGDGQRGRERTHLAVDLRVSASTQNQAFDGGLAVEGASSGFRAKGIDRQGWQRRPGAPHIASSKPVRGSGCGLGGACTPVATRFAITLQLIWLSAGKIFEPSKN